MGFKYGLQGQRRQWMGWVAIAGLTGPLLIPSIHAQPSLAPTNAFKRPPPTPDTPKGLGPGTANRGSCLVAATDIPAQVTVTPLVPQGQWGVTRLASPTLWFHVQYPPDPAVVSIPATLSLEARATNIKLHPKQYALRLPDKSGIFGLSLPYSLAPGQWYRWYLALKCSSAPGLAVEAELEISGFLYRQQQGADDQTLAAIPRLERLKTYADQGIWYDAFTEAAIDHCQQFPAQLPDVNHPLSRLLRDDDVNLAHIAQRPIICPGSRL